MENDIKEDDIISIHSDAIFFVMKKDIKTNIDGVEFVCKHNWTTFIRYDKLEMLYTDGTMTYKNAPSDLLEINTLGINLFLIKICKMIENEDENVLNYISKYQRDYLNDKLPHFCYISFGKPGELKISNLNLLGYMATICVQEIKRIKYRRK